MEKLDYAAGDLGLCDRHMGEWVGFMKVPHLQLGISDAALMASSDGAYGEVELRPSFKFANPRLRALVAATHAEMVAGFPSGRLFLDSIEQAMAVALVKDYALKHRPVQVYRGGLGAARLRRIRELVEAKMEDDLSLDDMAQSVGLSTAHFARMFRKSTGETPHQFVLRQRIERAKAMLRAPDARALDVAVACGFKTQQHFAQVFRDVCSVSPTEYRREVLGTEDTPHLVTPVVTPGSRPERRLANLPFTSLLTPVLSGIGNSSLLASASVLSAPSMRTDPAPLIRNSRHSATKTRKLSSGFIEYEAGFRPFRQESAQLRFRWAVLIVVN
jgi:AraC family transcriptional regulator